MLIDAHSHLDGYDDDSLDPALAEIDEHEIVTISNSMDVPSYGRNLDIAGRSRFVIPTFGIHPWNAPEYSGRLQELKDLVDRTPMFGEIGLDFHFIDDPSSHQDQVKVFEFFLRAAVEQGKAVSLHTKGAEREVLQRLDSFKVQRALVHWYSGDLDTMDEIVSLGAYFTVGFEVMSSEHIQDIAKRIPLDRLLTETDNPGGPRSLSVPTPMPLLVEGVLGKLAELRGMSAEDLGGKIVENFFTFIRDDPWLEDFYGRSGASDFLR